jgi:hypothetical protein
MAQKTIGALLMSEINTNIERLLDRLEIDALKSQLKAWREHKHERALTLDSSWCRCGNRWPCEEATER